MCTQQHAPDEAPLTSQGLPLVLVHAPSLCSGCLCACVPFHATPTALQLANPSSTSKILSSRDFKASFFYPLPVLLHPLCKINPSHLGAPNAPIISPLTLSLWLTLLPLTVVLLIVGGLRSCLIQNYLCLVLQTFFTSEHVGNDNISVVREAAGDRDQSSAHLYNPGKGKTHQVEELCLKDSQLMLIENESVGLFIGLRDIWN